MKRIILISLLIVAQTASVLCSSPVYLVHPSGISGADNAGAFDSIHDAVLASRSETGPRRIVLAQGEYYLDETVVLDHRDKGLAIEGDPRKGSILFGGLRVVGWVKDGPDCYSAPLPDLKDGEWDFRSLVVNGRLASRSRMPETGFFRHLSKFDAQWLSTTQGGWDRKPTERELTSLVYRPRDLGAWFDPLNAEITVFHNWDETLGRVKSIDRKNNILTFAAPLGHPPGAFGVDRYVVWNLSEGMTRPGQWRLDRPGERVVYRPLPNEDMTKAHIVAPVLESVIRIAGTREKPAKNISISGLTVSAAATSLIKGGFGAGNFEGAVSASFAENCLLSNVEIQDVGGQGVKAWGKGLEIRNCVVRRTGACGIRFGGPGASAVNNLVHNVGLIYPSAIALWGGKRNEKDRLIIRHNEIHDTPYTAIAVTGDGHAIENNLIYRAVQVLADGGGIYITFCNDVLVRGNLIRGRIGSGGTPEAALYLDEQAQSCIVENNLVLDCSWPLHSHMAMDNTIQNNVFISDSAMKLTFPVSGEMAFEYNVVSTKAELIIKHAKGIGRSKNNLLFGDMSGSESLRSNNAFADPLIMDANNGRVIYSPGSPVHELGVRPLDVSRAGRVFE